MSTRSNAAIAFYLFLVFGSGILVGAFGYRLYTVSGVSATSTVDDSPQARRTRFVADLKQRLGLRPEQVGQLNRILDEGRARSHEIHRKIDPELTALRHEQDGKISAMLDARQRAEFDRWRAEQDKAARRNGQR